MLDPARQAIRWSIPGAVFVLTAAGLELFLVPIYTQATLPGLLGLIDAGAAIAMILAGIPIGFLLYQAYFWIFDIGFVSLKPLSVPEDRGIAVLKELRPTQLEYIKSHIGLEFSTNRELRAICQGRWRGRGLLGGQVPDDNSLGGRGDYADRRRKNWRIVRWMVSSWLVPCEDATAREYRSLTDIYHALGASRLAVLAASGLVASYNVAAHWDELWSGRGAAAGVIGGVVVVLTLRILSATRAHTLQTILNDLRDAFRRFPECPEQRSQDEPLGPTLPPAGVRGAPGEWSD